jgi:ArsR family metal-binding transcriptional regulator
VAHKTSACFHCAYRIHSEAEATDILRDLIKTAHMRRVGDGGTLIEAHLSAEMEIRLCLWDADCEDCEDSHDAEFDQVEQDSQFSEVSGNGSITKA